MRIACDTGGTFTDLIVETRPGAWRMFKAPSTPADPIAGVLDALGAAAEGLGTTLAGLLAQATHFVHATTHPINAVLTRSAARTALLVTRGHPDVLVLREGGRANPFDMRTPFPEPYVPRALTFEVGGRIAWDGRELEPLDEVGLRALLPRLPALGVQALAVCFLWSIASPNHERRAGELIEALLPGMPCTLSHALNPAIREYRRASSSAIDASLKPIVSAYLGSLVERLRACGFKGRTLVVTSSGGMLDAAEVARAPILAINSGPAMAPVAGLYYAGLESPAECAIVADTGGTTFDVSVARDSRVPLTRELWIGEPGAGHITGFPSVAVKSIGAGGGSLAHVDAGGLLHVGPLSAGARPGPACYGRGGERATLTDAALVLGWLEPGSFLGGRMTLDATAARGALERDVSGPLGVTPEEGARAVLQLATETMAQAIADLTLHEGIDPARGVLIGGGGAAGFNIVAIARRIGCRSVLVPETGAALSAAGALLSEIRADFRATARQSSDRFDAAMAAGVLRGLERQAREFIARAAVEGSAARIEYFAEARYRDQVWELEIPLPGVEVSAGRLVEDFHREHERVFFVRDPGATVEVIGWRAAVNCPIAPAGTARLQPGERARERRSRTVHFLDGTTACTPVYDLDHLPPQERLAGPAIVDSSFTTVVVDPGAAFWRSAGGSLAIAP